MEIPVQQIGGNFAHFSLVRTIFFGSYTAKQPHLLHKPLHSLVIHTKPSATKCDGNTSIAISTFVFVVDGIYCCLYICVFIRLLHLFYVIVEGCTGQLSDFKQKAQGMFLP